MKDKERWADIFRGAGEADKNTCLGEVMFLVLENL